LVLDPDRALERAEDFLRRHMKSKATREAERRARQRAIGEFGRRVGRAAAVTGASGAGVLGYGLAVAPVGATGLIAAGAATLVAAGAALFWPSRRPQGSAALTMVGLGTLTLEAEDWLLRQRNLLPGRAAPSIDAILTELHDMQPYLARLDAAAPLAGEARRLIGEHLPRLVNSYLGVPASARDANPEIAKRLIGGLGIVAAELKRLCGELSRDEMLNFETQGRFLETRYGAEDTVGR
jgi:hypothetical protein